MSKKNIIVDHETDIDGLADWSISYNKSTEKFTGIASLLNGLEKVILYEYYDRFAFNNDVNNDVKIVYREHDGSYDDPIQRTFEIGAFHECPEVILNDFLAKLYK